MSDIRLELTVSEAWQVHHALYLRLRELSMVEDHNPDPVRRSQAVRDGAAVLAAADRLLLLLPDIKAS